MGRSSLDVVVPGTWLHVPQFAARHSILYTTVSIPALGSPLPPIQKVPTSLSLGIKRRDMQVSGRLI
jgi:hypothetical protein